MKNKFISKNPKIAYTLSIALSVLSVVIPIIIGLFFIMQIVAYFDLKAYVDNLYSNSLTINNVLISTYEESLQTEKIKTFSIGILFGISTILCLVFKTVLKNMLFESIQSNEYDEFGRSKKKSYKNLTRAERESIDLQKTADLERLLSSSVIKSITKEGSSDPLRDLKKLVGLQSVKVKVEFLINRMNFECIENKYKKKKDRTYCMYGRHFAFLGSAGTGKTVVARILTGALYQYGYIKENKIIEVDGNFFNAGDNSAMKTKYITEIARGGVLFIDEAYTMANCDHADEIIATLIKEMEDNRDKFICILAGYSTPMVNLFNKNEGFKSRIKEIWEFPDYTMQEMKDIFTLMCNEHNFAVSGDALDNLEIRLIKEKRLKGFGNGRTVRNIFEAALDRHSMNYTPETRYLITGIDIETKVNKIFT